MDRDIKREWLADLRDGTRTQGTGHLRKVVDGVTHQCCLDVLCEQMVRKGLLSPPEAYLSDEELYRYITESDSLGESQYLPLEVLEWAGLSQEDPKVEYVNEDEEVETYSLSDLNDFVGLSFTDIADIIDEQL